VEKLTSKQKIFVKEYAIDRNATRAAIAAGYSKNGAKVAGHRLLTNTNVRPKLDAQTTELLDNLGVKASYVLGGIVETIERCK
jgi:phage terminase small subunit